MEYLRRTEVFFDEHGGKTIVLSRFVPIMRTFAPFVAGIGRMHYGRFQMFNVGGGALGRAVRGRRLLVRQHPVIKDNFGVVTIVIIAASVIPIVMVLLRPRKTT